MSPALPAEQPEASAGPRSRSVTVAPRRASSRALQTPIAPPPMTTTSDFIGQMLVRRSARGADLREADLPARLGGRLELRDEEQPVRPHLPDIRDQRLL